MGTDISIVVPTFNRDILLKECLRSLANQTYPKDCFEVIVIDDGSKRNIRKIIDSFKGNLNIFYYHINHSGPAKARNEGVKFSKSDIISFIDDDCIAEPSWIENIIDIYKKNPEREIVQGKINLSVPHNILAESYVFISRYGSKNRVSDDGKCAYFFGTPNVSLKKKIFTEYSIYFDKNLPTREDQDFYYNIKRNSIKVFRDNRVVVNHKPSLNFISHIRRYFNYGIGDYRLYLKHKDQYINNRKRRIRYISFLSFKSLCKDYTLYKAIAIFIILILNAILIHIGRKVEMLHSFWK